MDAQLDATSTGRADDPARVAASLEESLAYARERDYRGWDYADGTSSRLLRAVPVESQVLNLAVQETVKRFPLNLRPLFRVEQRRNFKGTALFAMANLTAADLTGEAHGERDVHYEREARSLTDWLVEHSVDGYGGFCGCHRHDLQTLDGVVPAGTPGVVGTSYGVKALLRADERFERDYATVAETAADVLFDVWNYREVEDGAVIDYKPTDSGEHHTVNAVALGARLLVDLYDRFGTPRYLTAATELLEYVAARQADVGGWYYRDPPGASHLSMDNHHNGFVVETFQRYRAATGDDRFDDTLDDALDFYRNVLFEPTGAPNFDEEGPYPRDVHASAQGILVFTYAGDRGFARDIVEWTREHLGLGNGRYVSRKHRFHTKRHVLMRWCIAWMAYALSEYARDPAGAAEPFGRRSGEATRRQS